MIDLLVPLLPDDKPSRVSIREEHMDTTCVKTSCSTSQGLRSPYSIRGLFNASALSMELTSKSAFEKTKYLIKATLHIIEDAVAIIGPHFINSEEDFQVTRITALSNTYSRDVFIVISDACNKCKYSREAAFLIEGECIYLTSRIWLNIQRVTPWLFWNRMQQRQQRYIFCTIYLKVFLGLHDSSVRI